MLIHKLWIETLQFLTALPTRQDGVENRDEAYCAGKPMEKSRAFWIIT